jgi:SAM-dependent methyltransferase
VTSPEPLSRLKAQMFALSFTALFLELMVIRWVPSLVPFIAYYANLMLLSSFLGLGAGAMAGRSRLQLFDWFPGFLACEVVTLVLCREVMLGGSAGEARFFALASDRTLVNTAVLIWIFAGNALVFVPLGQRMGVLFNSLPRLPAYAWDLSGSLFGTLCFGLFSLMHFSPMLGMAAVMAVYLLISPRGRWALNVPVFAMVLVVVFLNGDRYAIWSPYQYLTISRIETPGVSETEPPPGLLTMVNPPVYSVGINQFFYQFDAAFDPARYTRGSRAGHSVVALWTGYYRVPYAIGSGRGDILVLGAGGGGDVSAALASGARHVDAVDIDPVVSQISRRFNAAAPYSDPRVTLHVDDARSYLAKARPGYDMVVFGLLDSHVLFSSMSSVRLDGYVYTVEGLRSAYRLLNKSGMLVLSFYAPTDWLPPKLYQALTAATGRQPVMYRLDRFVILCISRDPALQLPERISQFRRAHFRQEAIAGPMAQIDLPTDDWPFLYLNGKNIPSDYLTAIGSLLCFSLLCIAALRRRSVGAGDLHFGLMGMGFMLLETKSINDCTLYFGATWFVTMLVVAGVLLMVLAANLAAERIARFSLAMYAPLIIALVALILVPREQVLGLSFAGRMAWTLLAVPLPIFFAGIVFSTTFRESASPSAVFGANLIGAMMGGFCEYLTMAVGGHRLAMLVIAAYFGSMLTLIVAKRRGWAI